MVHLRNYSTIMTFHSCSRSFRLLFVFSFVSVTFSCKIKSGVNTTSDISVASHVANSQTPPLKVKSFDYLKSCMSGTFSSQEQSKNDSDFFDIQLRKIPIWEKTDNVFYLYVEQAVASMKDKPNRQRVYKVVKEDDTHFTSSIFTLPEPEKFVVKSEGDVVISTIAQEIIVAKTGCEVSLTFDPAKNVFTGSTGENTCPSERSGASWAMSKVNISNGVMISWDQGWDDKGQQVLGAVKSGYIIKKVS